MPLISPIMELYLNQQQSSAGLSLTRHDQHWSAQLAYVIGSMWMKEWAHPWPGNHTRPNSLLIPVSKARNIKFVLILMTASVDRNSHQYISPISSISGITSALTWAFAYA